METSFGKELIPQILAAKSAHDPLPKKIVRVTQ
jgi:hypothetical protein